jgi:uroporphyrinogen decarboxylase
MFPKLPPPNPDFDRLRKVLLRQGEPDRLPLIELFADREIMEAVLGEKLSEVPPDPSGKRDPGLDWTIRYWHLVGFDYVSMGAGVSLPRRQLSTADTAALLRDRRYWADENHGTIETWEDFENYPWPQPEQVNYSALEYLGKHLPDGMQIIFEGPGGQFENISWLMGYTPLSLALHDNPDLVQAVAEKIGDLLVNIFSTAAEMPNVGALWLGDDMGFKTGTLISPKHLRQYVFPVQKKLAEIAHAHDMPFLLHSCGDLSRVMDDLIDDVGIDAKHSWEDVITPVSEAKRRWGSRCAILGGIDVDFLCRSTEDEVRAHTRQVIEACAPGGGYALGTGNTVTNYIPVRNYLAMVEEGLKFRYS